MGWPTEMLDKPVRTAGTSGGVALGLPVMTENKADCPHALGMLEDWANGKVEKSALFQTSIKTKAVPPPDTVGIVCTPPKKYPAELPLKKVVVAICDKLIGEGPARRAAE
jgi:hypothetical protein